MSRLVLHRAFGSPPARSVMMLGDLLGLQMEYKEVNILKMEHKSPEFKKLNPMGTVPVLQDGDFVVSESHAILKYLTTAYGGERAETLYPRDVRRRALVDQVMFFNAGVFFTSFLSVTLPTLLEGLEGPNPAQLNKIDSALSVVDAYLQNRKYIAADHLTIADLSAGSTASVVGIVHKVDPKKYPRCADWLSRLEEEEVFKTVNAPGVAFLTKVINKTWEINKAKNKN